MKRKGWLSGCAERGGALWGPMSQARGSDWGVKTDLISPCLLQGSCKDVR